jgi:uncharacterized protein involved in cysteine biosynthesis
VSGRLRVLMCLAVLGVLVALGLVVASLTGVVGAVLYGAGALAVVLAGVVRGRRLLAPPPRAAGRTCDCCTTTHFDPVKVI